MPTEPNIPVLKSGTDPWIHIEPSPKRVRVRFGGLALADSRRVRLLLEAGRVPVYYFPKEDVRLDLLNASGLVEHHPTRGDAHFRSIAAAGKSARNAAWSYPDPAAACAEIRDCVAFRWDSMDAWYEEEEEVFVHARDPYKRIDVLQSSRHVRVAAAGETVADTRRPYLLLETGMPVRYYIPPDDVRMELLVPTDTVTRCPYKGTARYWSVQAGDRAAKDVVWSYPDPLPECPRIRGLLCFYGERVDALHVDGERQDAPRTPRA